MSILFLAMFVFFCRRAIFFFRWDTCRCLNWDAAAGPRRRGGACCCAACAVVDLATSHPHSTLALAPCDVHSTSYVAKKARPSRGARPRRWVKITFSESRFRLEMSGDWSGWCENGCAGPFRKSGSATTKKKPPPESGET